MNQMNCSHLWLSARVFKEYAHHLVKKADKNKCDGLTDRWTDRQIKEAFLFYLWRQLLSKITFQKVQT